MTLRWKHGPNYREARGVHLTTTVDGHTLEIHKGPRHSITGRDSKTVRYWLTVDSVRRGSDSPSLTHVKAEAGGMAAWHDVTTSLVSPAGTPKGTQ